MGQVRRKGICRFCLFLGNSVDTDQSCLRYDVSYQGLHYLSISHEEATKILQRYSSYDVSYHGQSGLSIGVCKLIPEFTGNVFAADVIDYHADPGTKKIHPRNFMKICAMFYRETPAKNKKLFLFDMFDVDKQKALTHDAMFRIYKLLFSNAISDDHILALTFSALRHPYLAKDGEVTRDEFLELYKLFERGDWVSKYNVYRMIPDSEIQEKLSIDFFSNET